MIHRVDRRAPPSSGFSVIEVLVAATVGLMVLGLAFGLLRFVRASSEKTLAPQVALQMASRSALVQLEKELQQCVEFIRPKQGSSLTYFIARDKQNLILTGYVARDDAASQSAGRDIYQLYFHRHDYTPGANPALQRKVLDGIERISFTTLSPGALQVHMTLHELDKSYSLLTTVRARNVLSEGEL